MKHIKAVDSSDHTVLMMQVENEVGVLGDSRDHSDAANQAFAGPVPAQLMQYLQAHRDNLYPDLRARWDANGNKPLEPGRGLRRNERTDEIFMAWNYGRYIQAVTKAGKPNTTFPCT